MNTLAMQRDIDLKPYNTMALSVRANYFTAVTSIAQMQEALAFAREHSLAVFVLGSGSNSIFTGDYAGLVIHVNNRGIEHLADAGNSVRLRVAAGEVWDDFLCYCLEHAYYGLENLAIIPGTVGASPVQNIGAYGQEVADAIESVEFVDMQSGALGRFDHGQCEFAYRDSIFKRQGSGRWLISHVVFRLQKQFQPNTAYKALQQYCCQQQLDMRSAASLRAAVIAIRQAKLPDPAQIPNSGSFFKNPYVSQEQLATLLVQYPQLPHYLQLDGRYKLAAAWLIEQAGFKGRQYGPVAMHSEQALVLVNNQGGSSGDVLALAETVRQEVQRLFSVRLEQEPILVP